MSPVETHAPEAVQYEDRAPRASTSGRREYAPPRLERLGRWNALTLQQSVQIFP